MKLEFTIKHPEMDLEAEGVTTFRNGTVRTISYLPDGSKHVVWDYSNNIYLV